MIALKISVIILSERYNIVHIQYIMYSIDIIDIVYGILGER